MKVMVGGGGGTTLMAAMAMVAMVWLALIGASSATKPSVSANIAAGAGPLLAQRLGVSEEEAVARMAHIIRFRTVSHANHSTEVSEQERRSMADSEAEFDRMLEWLEKTYARVFSALRRTKLDCHSLLLEWPGSDLSLKPFLLASHMDVVPIDSETESQWTHPPFSGMIADGFIWGRGTLDDKIGVIGILEAVEALIVSGFTPSRTMYIAFGHDEEVSGRKGALKIVQYLGQRNVSLEFALDEGGTNAVNILKQVSKPVALVGIAEKGYMSAELTVEGQGGHSSMPTEENAIAILSAAVTKLHNNPMPASISGAVERMLAFLAPHADSPVERFALSNLWLTSPLVRNMLDKGPAAASIRTTSAVTMFNAGIKDNVLPKKATAIVNFRILPGETPADCLEHIKRTVRDDRIKVRELVDHTNQPSPISPTDSYGWKVIQGTIAQHFPEAVVVPYLTLGATDGRYYHALTPNVYRYIPYLLGPNDLARIHGVNERIAVSDVMKSIGFYARLIVNAQASKVETPSHDEL